MLRPNPRRQRRQRQTHIILAAVLASLLAAAAILCVCLFVPQTPNWKKNVIPREGKPLSVVWSYRARTFSLKEGMNVDAPTWLYVEADDLGKPVLKDLYALGYESFNASAYVHEAHTAGVKVWATIVSFEPELSRQIVADLPSRTEFAAAVAQWVESSGVDGVCFDFEYMDPADKDQYTALVQSTVQALNGKTVAVAVTVPLGYEDERNWYQCYDRAALAEAADYLALMTYDAHKERLQPVAPLPWVRRAVERTLNEVPSSKLLLGLPFYGVDFSASGEETPNSSTISAASLEKLLTEGRMGSDDHEIVVEIWENRGTWLEDQAVMEYVFTDTKGIRHTIWMDSEASLHKKGDLMNEYSLAGAAVWRKSQGTENLWKKLADITADTETPEQGKD